MFDLGQRLREARLISDMSQKDVGKKLGVSPTILVAWENNYNFPSIDKLIKISDLYSVSVDYLIGISNKQGILINGYSQSQQELLKMLVIEFKDGEKAERGLTMKQQDILNQLFIEFTN